MFTYLELAWSKSEWRTWASDFESALGRTKMYWPQGRVRFYASPTDNVSGKNLVGLVTSETYRTKCLTEYFEGLCFFYNSNFSSLASLDMFLVFMMYQKQM